VIPGTPNGPVGRLMPHAAQRRFDSSCSGNFLELISRMVWRHPNDSASDLPPLSLGLGSFTAAEALVEADGRRIVVALEAGCRILWGIGFLVVLADGR